MLDIKPRTFVSLNVSFETRATRHYFESLPIHNTDGSTLTYNAIFRYHKSENAGLVFNDMSGVKYFMKQHLLEHLASRPVDFLSNPNETDDKTENIRHLRWGSQSFEVATW